MTQIVLTAQQASVLSAATEPVAICRPDGTLVAVVPHPGEPGSSELTPEEIAEFRRRAQSAGPWYSVEELFQRVKARAEACDRTT